MKKFDTAHIVQLYGVVSNGQPALMVLEYYWLAPLSSPPPLANLFSN